MDAATYRLMFGRLGKWSARPIGHAQFPMCDRERADRLAAVARMRAEVAR
jgi:hypothetical protein